MARKFLGWLGGKAQPGRTFAADEEKNGGAHGAILRDWFWKAKFAAKRDVVGASLRINDEAYTVIGVMPQWYRLQSATGLWVPLDMAKAKLGSRWNHQLGS